MKLENREITLNEQDSVFEMICLEKLLAESYLESLFFVERKEVGKFLTEAINEGVQTLFSLQNLVKEKE